MNLQQAIADLKIAIDGIRTAHPELDGDPEFAAEVFSAETDIEGVLAKLVSMALDAGSRAEAMATRVIELRMRQDRHELKEEKLRSLILNVMERAGLPKVQLTEATLSVRHIPPAPIVVDEGLLPDECVKVIRKPDMGAIRDCIEAGQAIPGVVLSNGRSSLAVRTK